MEYSCEARRENLRRNKSKSSNYSGKFLSLPSEIVALRYLRTPLVTLPLKTRSYSYSQLGGDKRNLDPPLPPSHGSFVNDYNICHGQQRTSAKTSTLSQFFRSGVKLEYQGLLTFRIQYKVFKGGRKFIPARPEVNFSRQLH